MQPKEMKPSLNSRAVKSQRKTVAVIKNGLTKKQMDELGEQWANHPGPYMTVAETLAYAAKRDKKAAANAVQGAFSMRTQLTYTSTRCSRL